MTRSVLSGALLLAALGCVDVAGSPDVTLVARTAGGRFEVRDEGGWRPFFVKGVNLGAALPGRFPSEFPDSAVYADWLDQIGEMGANTLRLYTRHPPHFYQALRAYNLRRPGAPLWLLHGVWAELPPEHFRYDDRAWQAEFHQDIEWVVDIVHGRADIPRKPGLAGGRYDADVSSWTLGYILGREWEAYSVHRFDSLRSRVSGWRGRFLEVEGGGAMDAWLGRAAERMIAHETGAYGAQRPIAYTNWPTTDPIRHPTEAPAAVELQVRRGRGEVFERSEFWVGEDEVSLDPNRFRATPAFRAGFFASYHAYPYYPDFMLFDPEYRTAVSPFGPSNYWGYLQRLKAHHAGMPLLIAEYGIPSSLGVSHVSPQGWHHGGKTEAEAAELNARLTREIHAAGLAGGVLFAWIDEWFKKTWVTQQFEVPEERSRLWRNRLDSEEHYGVLALEPEPRLPGTTFTERLEAWQEVPALYGDPEGPILRAMADEAYLWLAFDPGPLPPPERVLVGFDVIDPERGDFRWPDRVGPRLPVGVETVLDARRDTVRILHDTWSVGPVITPVPFEGGKLSLEPPIEEPPPGFIRGQYDIVENVRIFTQRNEDGRYLPPVVLIHDRRFGPDTTEYAAMGYDRGILPGGPSPDGFWEWTDRGQLEVRIPWQLLNIGDPSSLMALQDSTQGWKGGPLQAVPIEGIGIIALALGLAEAPEATLPASDLPEDVALFSWPAWERPVWRTRRKPTFEAMRRVWAELGEGPWVEDRAAAANPPPPR